MFYDFFTDFLNIFNSPKHVDWCDSSDGFLADQNSASRSNFIKPLFHPFIALKYILYIFTAKVKRNESLTA